MPESTLVAAVTEFAKAALSDAAKEYLRDWLTDVVRIKRAINRISLAFSTQVPGAKDALEVWVKTEAFRLAMGEVISGRALPESLTRVDDFLVATGVGFGSLSRDVVSDMLAAFYRAIREELVTARSGLVLTDNRVGEVLREVHELRSDLAANLPSRERLGLPRVSRELLNGLAKEQGWGANIGYASEIHINLELPPSVQTISKRPATVHSILHILRTATWYAIHGGSGSGKTQLAILVGQAFVGPKRLAIRAVAKGIKAARRVDPSTETKIEGELDLQTGLLTLLWVIAAWIRTDEEYQQWLAALADLTPDELANWRTIHLGDQASEAICGGVWTRTADLPDLERNWVGVLGELKRLEAWARSAGASWLATCTVRSQIIVTAEYQKDIRKADVIARQGMEEFQDLPKAKFWIADTMARQHHYFGEAADAVHWFDLALASQDAVDVGARVSALTLAGVAASRLGIDGIDPARRYFEQGGTAADSKRVGALLRVTVKGELGILLWNTGHRREAYTAWSGAVQELLAARSETKQWKNLLRLVGNCTGYFILNSRGATIEGAEMTTPFPGILLREITDILGLYKPEDDWLLPVQMVLFAESVGAFDDAINWAARTKVCDGAFGAGSQALITGAQVVRDLADHQYEKIVLESDIGDLDEAGDPWALPLQTMTFGHYE